MDANAQWDAAFVRLKQARAAGNVVAERQALADMKYWSEIVSSNAAAGLTPGAIIADLGKAVGEAIVEAPGVLVKGAGAAVGEIVGAVADGITKGVTANPVVVAAIVIFAVMAFTKK